MRTHDKILKDGSTISSNKRKPFARKTLIKEFLSSPGLVDQQIFYSFKSVNIYKKITFVYMWWFFYQRDSACTSSRLMIPRLCVCSCLIGYKHGFLGDTPILTKNWLWALFRISSPMSRIIRCLTYPQPYRCSEVVNVTPSRRAEKGRKHKF